MNEEVNGHVTMNVYLVFDKTKLADRNSRYINTRIDLDDYIYQFDKDLWGVSDAHAQAERDLDKYLDALIAYTKNIIEHMFDSCTFDVWKTPYTSDVEVASDGIATIYMNSNVWFDGVNPSLSRDEIVAELKQQIDNRHSGDLAGIGNSLTEVVIDVHID